MLKVMVLTGSDGNPRSFPPTEMFDLEDTYPYLLRKFFPDSTFWQLSFGNITTTKLVSQPMAYLTHWKPDIIIVQSGMTDCRPEAFTDFQKEVIKKLTWRFMNKYLDHPEWVKRRQLYRVPPKSFETTIKKFKMIFPKSKVFWMEICADEKYEQARPGLIKRMDQYNEIIRRIYGPDFVPVQKKMTEVGGFNGVDHVHWNKKGHQAIADVLKTRIDAHLMNQQVVGYGSK